MLQPWGQISASTLGTNYADKSLHTPTHCPTWGEWGLHDNNKCINGKSWSWHRKLL